MPFRSPKMYAFIFGFQRFVWCPKWTPASSRSFNAIPLKVPPENVFLSLAELEALARSFLSVFLSLLDARVSRQESRLLEALAQRDVLFPARARDAEAQRAGLS